MGVKIDTLTLSWAVHSLSGISSPANAAYSEAELVFQLKSSGSKALFTCLPLLPIALQAAAKSGIPKKNVYLLALPKEFTLGLQPPPDCKTVDQLIEHGSSLPPLEPLKWDKGQAARQTAFLCYSSGTSGLPVRMRPHYEKLLADTERRLQKGVMISHRNVMANVLQVMAFEKPSRDSRQEPGSKYTVTDVVLGLLPQSHIYALVVVCHATIYRGDQVINLPKFEMSSFLNAIQRFRINQLFLVGTLLSLSAPSPRSLRTKLNVYPLYFQHVLRKQY